VVHLPQDLDFVEDLVPVSLGHASLVDELDRPLVFGRLVSAVTHLSEASVPQTLADLVVVLNASTFIHLGVSCLKICSSLIYTFGGICVDL